MSNFWKQVETLIAQGKGASITLTEAMEVKMPKKKGQSHRRRPWEKYTGSRDGMSRPRCNAVGCEKYLKQSQPLCCSKECEDNVLRGAMEALAILKYRLIERVRDYEPKKHDSEILKKLVEDME